MKLVNFSLIIAVLLVAVFTFSCASSGGSTAAAPAEPVYVWNLSDPAAGTAGWDTANDEFWDFDGTMTVRRDDTTMGKPMLRVDVDYSKNTGSWWSEPKLIYTFAEPLELANVNRFIFDMYVSPQHMTTGSFKGKIIGFLGSRPQAEAELDSIRFMEEVGDYLKATVSFRVRSSRQIDSMRIGIVGAVTDYNGPIFLDNIRWE